MFDVHGAEGGQGWPRACRMAGKPNAGGRVEWMQVKKGTEDELIGRSYQGSWQNDKRFKKSLHHPGWLILTQIHNPGKNCTYIWSCSTWWEYLSLKYQMLGAEGLRLYCIWRCWFCWAKSDVRCGDHADQPRRIIGPILEDASSFLVSANFHDVAS